MSNVWDLLTGQARVEQMLRVESENPGRSMLFFGPPGAGKTQAARVFAAAVLCPDSCGHCNICARVLKDVHPDVQFYQPEGYTYPVVSIRQMVSWANQSPLEGTRRVFIVEEADRIIERSQNALLKALEEPSAATTWVLLASSLDVFLPTVLSRCRMIEFAPIAEESVRALLAERFEVDPTQAELVAQIARGDIDRAIELATDPKAMNLRTLAIKACTRIEPTGAWALSVTDQVQQMAADVRSVVSVEQAEELSDLEELVGSGRGTATAKKRLQEKHKRALRRAETGVYLDFLSWMGMCFRDLAAAALGVQADDLVASDHASDIVSAARSRPPAFWLQEADRTQQGRLALVENANPSLYLDSVLLDLSIAATPEHA